MVVPILGKEVNARQWKDLFLLLNGLLAHRTAIAPWEIWPVMSPEILTGLATLT